MDRGVWTATLHGVAKSQTRLSDSTHHSLAPRVKLRTQLLAGREMSLIYPEWKENKAVDGFYLKTVMHSQQVTKSLLSSNVSSFQHR